MKEESEDSSPVIKRRTTLRKGPKVSINRPEMLNEDSETEDIDKLSVNSRQDPVPISLRKDAPLNDYSNIHKVDPISGNIKPNDKMFGDGIIGAYFKREKRYTPAQISVKEVVKPHKLEEPRAFMDLYFKWKKDCINRDKVDGTEVEDVWVHQSG